MAELTLRELIATEITNCVEESRKSGVVRNFTYADNIRNILRDRIKTMGLTDEEIAKAKGCECYEMIKEGEGDCETCSANCRTIIKVQLDKVLKELE